MLNPKNVFVYVLQHFWQNSNNLISYISYTRTLLLQLCASIIPFNQLYSPVHHFMKSEPLESPLPEVYNFSPSFKSIRMIFNVKIS